ncbi:Hypothetical predicted protein [Olea europaea subsp. europaea]|uniref:Uncharacterized protein n=1 Tax=Olea europaea subsp. europaea TaxID=158383 RepID=A0A8S0TDF1_OLEEU|nr:Hypothetical predicted protein [Olea europaea subsp. europaea]
MGRRNRRQRANERRRKMRTYESEPELGSVEQSELSHENSYPPSDTHIYEAQVRQMQNVHNPLEIKVDSPISNANAQNFIDHQRKVNFLHKAVLRGDWNLEVC